MKKFDKIYREGKDDINTFAPDEEVYIEEKLDGANFRVWRDDKTGKLQFGSRKVDFLPEDDENAGYSNFIEAVEYIKSLNTEVFVKGVLYFFEYMKKHTINYDWEHTPKAVLLDALVIDTNMYVDSSMIETIANNLGCDRANVIFEGKYKDFDGKIPKSVYYDGPAEGYVIKPVIKNDVQLRDEHGNIHRAKVVGDKFKEEKTTIFGSTDDVESKFVEKYCTHGRIKKHINKIEEMGYKFELKMIGKLTFNIMKDICDEEFKKVVKMGTPNFKTIRKEIQIRVKQYLTSIGVM